MTPPQIVPVAPQNVTFPLAAEGIPAHHSNNHVTRKSTPVASKEVSCAFVKVIMVF